MSTTAIERVELPITGMTCASCANRIERRLNKLDGVTATVNYATEKARVEFDPGTVAPEQLVAAVEAAGYQAALPADRAGRRRRGGRARTRPRRCGSRLILAALLSVPALLLAMIPALQFDNFQWLSLNLVTPVVLWAAWPFHKAAWANLKHGAATMDTLISRRHAGRVAVVAVRAVHRRRRHERHAHGLRRHPQPGRGRRPDLPRDRGHRHHLPARRALLRGQGQAPRRRRPEGAAGARRQGRRRSSTPTARERRIPVEQLAVGDRFVVRPGEKVATDGIVEQGTSAVDMSMLTGESVPGRGRARRGDRRRHRQRRRAPDRARHQGRRRHRAGADRAAGRGRPDRQGAGPAPRRPHLRHLRADRHRACRSPRSASGSGTGESATLRVHRRRRGAHHRLPVRARARHADGADGRHRPRRAARPAHQGPRGPGVHPPRRHGRARQDRHRDHRQDEPRRGHRRRRRRPRRGAAARRRARARLRAPDRPGHRHGGRGRGPAARRSRASPTARASASRASSTATR